MAHNDPPLPGEALAMFAQHLHKAFRQRITEPEQRFRELDVQPGDRIRLTDAHPFAKDPSTLEGYVREVKVKDGVSRVQVEGFHHIGNDIWWPVTRYKVEVLHKAFRMTDDDRLIMAMADIDENEWRAMNDKTRLYWRTTLSTRVDRVRSLLGVDRNAPEG